MKHLARTAEPRKNGQLGTGPVERGRRHPVINKINVFFIYKKISVARQVSALKEISVARHVSAIKYISVARQMSALKEISVARHVSAIKDISVYGLPCVSNKRNMGGQP